MTVRSSTFDPLDAVLFDLDGVLTPTAEVHMAAWARLFGPYLEAQGAPQYSGSDYFRHIDGRPRFEGVSAVLASRGLTLPYGDPGDAPVAATVCGLGNRKNEEFGEALRADGVTPYAGSVAFLDALRSRDAGRRSVAVAVVSSSKNARAVLDAAGLTDRFEHVVDGEVATRRQIAGKPAPDTYLYAAALLGVSPARAVVVEDATSGVVSGRAGEFGCVVGVDRGAGRQALLDGGADVVVRDLSELVDGLGVLDGDDQCAEVRT